MKIKTKLSILFISLFLLFISFANAQNVNDDLVDAINNSEQTEFQVIFKQFNSCEDMETVLQNYIQKLKYNDIWRGYGRGGGGVFDDVLMLEKAMPVGADMAEAEADITSQSSSNEYSTTNLQKIGVEEPEIIKTDGEYIYYYNQQEKKIYIIKSPLDIDTSTININDAQVITIINIPEKFGGINMFIQDGKLIVIGSRSMTIEIQPSHFLQRDARTSVAIYDISDINDLELVKFTDIDGYYSESRMIGDKLYLLTDMYIDRWRIREMEDVEINTTDFMPKAVDILNDDVTIIEPNCDDISYIMPSDETMEQMSLFPNFTVISVIDTDDINQEPKLNVLLGQNGEIHMSQESLYIAQTIWTPYRRGCGLGNRCITPWFEEGQQTLIHKFDIDGFDIDYRNSNMVEGSLLTQYSMDEDRHGNFRILTSKNWGEGTNFYTLDENLALEGKIIGIEPGEQFESSRYIGDKLYLVTFEQTDPLFVIDIADTTNPKILGELIIPGFSTYLHPMGELENGIQYLIGLGYNTEDNQRGGVRNAGIKVDLYKIDYNSISDSSSDTAGEHINIEQLYTKTFGGRGSNSEVLNNPRLFVMTSDNTITLPMLLQEERSNGESCTIVRDKNGTEITSDCYPIKRQETIFAGLKSLKISVENGITEDFSVNYLNLYKELYKSDSYYYNISPRHITNSNMRVGFAGDALYMLNNDFGHFILPSNNSYKYFYFDTNIEDEYPVYREGVHQVYSQVSQAKIEVADRAVHTMMGSELVDAELAEAVTFLHKYSVTKFDNSDDFMPEQAIRRDEAAKMFVKFYEELLEEREVEEATNSCDFSDLSNARPDLPDFIQKSCEYELFKGYKGKFMPTDNITNGQAVVVLIRLLDGIQDEESVDHYAQNYMALARERGLLVGLNLDLEKYRDLPATRKSIAKLLYRAR